MICEGCISIIPSLLGPNMPLGICPICESTTVRLRNKLWLDARVVCGKEAPSSWMLAVLGMENRKENECEHISDSHQQS